MGNTTASLTHEISIHALREEGDILPLHQRDVGAVISIHALREEGDEVNGVDLLAKVRFLSTPSARRATMLCRSANSAH